MKQWLCSSIYMNYCFWWVKMSESRVLRLCKILFLPPSIPSKWRGLRGLVVHLRDAPEDHQAQKAKRNQHRGLELERATASALRHTDREGYHTKGKHLPKCRSWNTQHAFRSWNKRYQESQRIAMQHNSDRKLLDTFQLTFCKKNLLELTAICNIMNVQNISNKPKILKHKKFSKQGT